MAEVRIGGNYREGADQRLVDIIQRAADASGLVVELTSGSRPGDKRQHGKDNAVDITLIDPATGQRLPNYQNAATFRTYEQFAQAARQIQRAEYPELDRAFRWGGYFSGPKGKYGAMDLMHFDLAGERLGMAGGSWDKGLTGAQRKLLPGAVSVGFNDHPVPQMNIPSVGTELSTAFAPTPATKSPALEAITSATGGKVAPTAGIPSQYDSFRTPQQVAELYQGILPRAPSNPLAESLVGGATEGIRSPTLFGDVVGVPNAMVPPDDATYSGENRMGIGGLGALLGRSASPAVPNPALHAAGVGGANIAGQVQLPRSVVPEQVRRDMAAINALPPMVFSSPRPTQAQMQAIRAVPDMAPAPATMSPSLTASRAAPVPATMSPGLAASRLPPIPQSMSPSLASSRLELPSIFNMTAPIPASVASMQLARASQPQQQARAASPAGQQQLFQAGPYTYAKTPQGYVKVGGSSTSGGSPFWQTEGNSFGGGSGGSLV